MQTHASPTAFRVCCASLEQSNHACLTLDPWLDASPQEAGDVYQSSLLFIQAVQARSLQWPTTRSYKAIVHGLVKDIVVLYYLLQQTAKALSINARNAPSSFFLGLRGFLHLQKRRALTFRFQDIESTPRTVISSSRLSSCASSMRLGLPYIYLPTDAVL